MKNKLIAPLIVIALLVGGGSFYGGMQYQKSKGASSQFAGGARGTRGAGAGAFGGQGGRAGGGGAAGQVISKDATSVTIKLTNGGSKNIFTSTSTKIGKMADGTMDDITPGTEVVVTGTPNQDGSITATMLQIRPAGQFPGGAPGQGGQPAGKTQ